MAKHQITIIDIANQLGISKSTVSRALTGHQSVHQHTREKVLALAAELEYEKNMFSISLIKKSSKTLGIIVPEFSRSFFPQIIIAAQKAAKEAGYDMIIAQSNESYETELANTKVMLAHRVDGVLISMTRETNNYDHFKTFHRKGIPIVFFNRVCEEMIVPKVVVDDFDGAFLAVEHLIKQGKKRIAHLSGPETLAVSKKRKAGYIKALEKYGLPVDEDLIIHYDLSISKVKIYINYFLNLEKRPDAIFAINDPTAIELIQLLKAADVKIPKEIAVVGFSNDFAGSIIEPSLTTVEQPINEIGETAVKLLLDQIDREAKDWKAPTIMLKTNLIIRNSS
ncbi:LacI family DNA-binding transcriptional regulator [Pedobacter sp. UBA5917]|jgi:LacI family transcriptional regulator/LacI family repressor for deo operon, udp, cdd, tsx, nupC, and nupG|uniref:LacI family DNA-binding transcriptional regulator n=1 Tax=Pedobacter sp. UBA5917 TaxID=1947061 RepID=UPI0025D891A5|nr:LacI family DNA-binding transcriptional regulator [Pedobacter sp. UBA5917]